MVVSTAWRMPGVKGGVGQRQSGQPGPDHGQTPLPGREKAREIDVDADKGAAQAVPAQFFENASAAAPEVEDAVLGAQVGANARVQGKCRGHGRGFTPVHGAL